MPNNNTYKNQSSKNSNIYLKNETHQPITNEIESTDKSEFSDYEIIPKDADCLKAQLLDKPKGVAKKTKRIKKIKTPGEIACLKHYYFKILNCSKKDERKKIIDELCS